MALLGIIRRWHIREHIPLREIARRLGISRNTVRRYLRSETIEPAYAERRSTRAIDKYAFQLSALLKTEAAKSRKQRRTLKQIHEDLKELGFEGSYDRGAAFARTWREGQSERVNPASKRTGLPSRGYPARSWRLREGRSTCACDVSDESPFRLFDRLCMVRQAAGPSGLFDQVGLHRGYIAPKTKKSSR